MYGRVPDWGIENACGWQPPDGLDHSKHQIPLLHAREVRARCHCSWRSS